MKLRSREQHATPGSESTLFGGPRLIVARKNP